MRRAFAASIANGPCQAILPPDSAKLSLALVPDRPRPPRVLNCAGSASRKGSRDTSNYWQQASPIEQLHADAPPTLILQGTRDRLAEIGLMRTVVSDLGSFATLHVIEDADHSFNMLKRSGRSNADALTELSTETIKWINDVLAPAAP